MIDFSNNEPAGTLSQDEMAANIQNSQERLDGKYRDNVTKRIVGNVRIDEMKKKAMNELFDILQQNGIDPEDQQAMSAFIEKMKTDNPELYSILEYSINLVMKDMNMPTGNQGQLPPQLGDDQTQMPGTMEDQMAAQDSTAPEEDMSQLG